MRRDLQRAAAEAEAERERERTAKGVSEQIAKQLEAAKVRAAALEARLVDAKVNQVTTAASS